jgi:hypothetical protein
MDNAPAELLIQIAHPNVLKHVIKWPIVITHVTNENVLLAVRVQVKHTWIRQYLISHNVCHSDSAHVIALKVIPM